MMTCLSTAWSYRVCGFGRIDRSLDVRKVQMKLLSVWTSQFCK